LQTRRLNNNSHPARPAACAKMILRLCTYIGLQACTQYTGRLAAGW
jgi:hypothetical protein